MRTLGVRSLILMAVVAFVCTVHLKSAPSAQYSVVDLGAFEPTGINANGDVVGYALEADGHWHSFLWRQGLLTDFGTLGAADATAFAINADDQITGVINTDQGFDYFLLTNGTVQTLGAPVDGYATNGLNDAGQVVGLTGGMAFVYSGGSVQYLDAPGCGSSRAMDINNSGLVVGYGTGGNCGAEMPTVWQDGAFDILPIPVGTSLGQTWKVNAVGQIAGFAYNPSPRAVRWQRDGSGDYTATDLGLTDNAWAASGVGINDSGVVVGELDTFSGESGFVWDPVNGMQDLNSLIPQDSGMVLAQATSINAAGMIIGRWFLNGQHRTYLLTPADATPPVVSVPGPTTVDPTSQVGAVVSFSVTASDPDDVAGPVICSPASGSVFPIGTTAVSCSSTDSHGNTGTSSFAVTVRSPAEVVSNLIATIEVDSFQQANNLLQNVLQSVSAGNTGAACSQLGAFVNQVQAQSGKKLTASESIQLVQSANDARAALGCRNDQQ